VITFVVVSPTVRSDSKKSVKSVVGGNERFDVLARCLLNLDRWKKRMNQDFNLLIYLSHPEEQIALDISTNTFPIPLKGELDSVLRLIDIFDNPEKYNFIFEVIDFRELINRISLSSSNFYLTSTGQPIDSLSKTLDNNNICFVLGSQLDLTESQEEALQNAQFRSISLGKLEYLSSHVITIICNQLRM
jgi:tRNA pseudouridine-54 N-methylase